jgi:hypothetical protein
MRPPGPQRPGAEPETPLMATRRSAASEGPPVQTVLSCSFTPKANERLALTAVAQAASIAWSDE